MGVALGATTEDIDPMCRDARIQQQTAVDGGQINATGLVQAKLTRYVRAYFVAALANAGSNRCVDVGCFRSVQPVHFFQGTDHNTSRRAAPSRMHRGYRAISLVSQQDWVTIGRANRYRNAYVRCHQRIAFTRASDLLPKQHDPGVDLFKARHAFLRDRVGASAKSVVEPLQIGEQRRIQHVGLVDCPIQQQ